MPLLMMRFIQPKSEYRPEIVAVKKIITGVGIIAHPLFRTDHFQTVCIKSGAENQNPATGKFSAKVAIDAAVNCR